GILRLGGWIERKESAFALVDSIEPLCRLVPNHHAPGSLGFPVVAPQRNALLANGQLLAQFFDGVCSRRIHKDPPCAEASIYITLIVDAKRAADRVPVIDSSLVHLGAGCDIVVNKVSTRVRKPVDAIELWIVGPGIHTLEAWTYPEVLYLAEPGIVGHVVGTRIAFRRGESSVVEPPSSVGGKIDSPILALPKPGVNLRLRTYFKSLLSRQLVQVPDINHLVLL